MPRLAILLASPIAIFMLILSQRGPIRTQAQSAFLVDTTRDAVDLDPGDGICQSAAGCSLRAAVQQANARPGLDRIELPAGHYVLDRIGPGEDGAETGDLDLLDDLVLRGAGVEATRIDGKLADRVLEAHGTASLTIEGLLIERGVVRWDMGEGIEVGQGGCIRAGAALTIRDAILRDCEASNSGGAVHAAAGLEMHDSRVERSEAGTGGGISADTAWITGSTVYANKATGGGGLAIGRHLLLQDSRLESNQATNGGGLSSAGVAVVIDSRVLSNRGTGGGGIWHRGELYLLRSSVEANRATGGGGIELDGLGLIRQSSIVGNRATSADGIEHRSSGQALQLINSTFSGNEGIALRSSGPLSITHATFADGQSISLDRDAQADISSSILGGSCIGQGISRSRGTNLGRSASCGLQAALGDHVARVELEGLEPVEGGTLGHRPSDGSPAIDGAAAASCPEVDQRGHGRPAGAACDIGALELGAAANSKPSETAWPSPTALPPSSTPTPFPPEHRVTPVPIVVGGEQGGLELVDQWGGMAKALVEMEDLLLLAQGRELLVIDPARPAAPIGRHGAEGMIRDLVVEGRVAALRVAGAVEIVDLSRPEAPRLAQHLPIEALRSPAGASAIGPDRAGGVVMSKGRIWVTTEDQAVESARDSHLRLLVAESDGKQWRWVGSWDHRQRSIDGSLAWQDTVVAGDELWIVNTIRTRDEDHIEVLALDPSSTGALQPELRLRLEGSQPKLVGGGDRLVLAMPEPVHPAASRIQIRDARSEDLALVAETIIEGQVQDLGYDPQARKLVAGVLEGGSSTGEPYRSVARHLIEESGRIEQGFGALLPAVPAASVISGPVAYILDLEGSLHAFDTRGSGSVTRIVTGIGSLAAIDRAGEILYALPAACAGGWTTDPDRLLTLDIEPGRAARRLGSWSLHGGASSVDSCFYPRATSHRLDVDAKAQRALISSGAEGLSILSLEQPGQPRLLGRPSLVDAEGRALYIDAAIGVGERAYVHSSKGLHVLDLGRPQQPKELARIDAPSTSFGTRLAARGALLVETGGNPGVYDISVPEAPRRFPDFDLRTVAYISGGYDSALALGDRLAFASSFSSGWQAIDLSTPDAPRQLSERRLVEPHAAVRDLALVGTILVIAGDNGGLWVFDVADPSRPELQAQYSLAGAASDLAIHGDRIYVAAGEGGLAMFRYPPLARAYQSYLPRVGR